VTFVQSRWFFWLRFSSSLDRFFVREAIDQLFVPLGFGILVPPWWNKKGARLGVKVKMKSKGGDANAKSRMSLENPVNYQWKLSLGETKLTEAEFKEGLLDSTQKIVAGFLLHRCDLSKCLFQ
jgi:hypothetical protein